MTFSCNSSTSSKIQECGEKPMFHLQSQWNPENHLLPVRSAWETSARNQSVLFLWRNTPRNWRDFGSALPFQTRLTQTKPVLPLSNEHGSQVKSQGRRQCCHNKHKNFPYRPTRDVSLLSGHASFIRSVGEVLLLLSIKGDHAVLRYSSAFYESRMPIAMCTKSRHWSKEKVVWKVKLYQSFCVLGPMYEYAGKSNVLCAGSIWIID